MIFSILIVVAVSAIAGAGGGALIALTMKNKAPAQPPTQQFPPQPPQQFPPQQGFGPPPHGPYQQ
ncbi:hypothetical protein AB0I53_47015 [Saccharopolyspora sp. NPDC050389]|uniref:hypothetical protein n=1 Tax=Saccharopolyspora sp. NPDC050389 TaxID=3155516 RepID=UPI0033E0658C